MSVYIGNVEIKNPLVLAPMAGISNSAFREICCEFGCGLVVCEMVSSQAIHYKNKKTLDMLYMTEKERPISQQIFGNNPKIMSEAAKFIFDCMHPDIIDINMGCPVPKVVSTGSGSALLKNLDLIYEIVNAVVNAVSCPVTVKIRSGWDFDSINAVDVAKVIEKAGASAICVHARTRSQGYSGNADWNIIREVVNNVSIPVIGNGDIRKPEDIKNMMDYTGCSLVMVGRGAIGNPWIFSNSLLYLSGKKYILPGRNDRIDIAIVHLKKLLDIKDEHIAVLEFRTHVSFYLKGIYDSNEVKNKIFKTNNASDIINILTEFRGDNSD